jgi:hypothetical protein
MSKVEAFVDAAAALAGFELSEESRAAVIANTQVLQGMQVQFMELHLADDLDPLPVLRL